MESEDMQCLPRYWLERLFIAATVLATCVLAYINPDAVPRSGSAGVVWIALLFALGLFAVADVIINDIMPKRYVLHMGRELRHWVYISIAIGFAGLAFAAVRDRSYAPLFLHYLVNAAAAVAVSILDLFARHREPS
jgi:hypothetical protein